MILLAGLLICLPVVTSRSQFVLNGDPVDNATKYPWQGSLQTSDYGPVCGCALIHINWVVTAAHCFSINYQRMEFGSVIHGEGQFAPIEQFVIHPDFNDGPGAFPNDLAIIRTSGLVQGPTITPVALSSGDDVTMSECWVSGWGSIGFDTDEDISPDQLHEAVLPAITSATCEGIWGDDYNQEVHICAWDDMGQVSACHADAGGPLSCLTEDTWTLEGVFSFGYSGCLATYPSVFVRISSYRAWVCEESQGDVC